MPFDYRILQSLTKEQVLFVLLETAERSLQERRAFLPSIGHKKGSSWLYV